MNFCDLVVRVYSILIGKGSKNMMVNISPNTRRRFAALTLLALAPLGSVLAQQQPASPLPRTSPIATPEEPASIPLYSGVAPGSEGAKQPEQWVSIMDQRMVRNTTKPTLTPFLPAPGKATAPQ
jgi:hypothetical protein